MKLTLVQLGRMRILFWLVPLLALGLATYLVAVEKPRSVYQHTIDRGLLYLHIVGAAGAIVLGPLLFLRASHRASLRVFHRWFGRCYVVCIGIASSSSFFIARLYEPGGWVSQLGIATAAVAWGTSTMLAWWRVRHHQTAEHREWMIRSYGLTLAFVTHRAWVSGATTVLSVLGGSVKYGAPLGDWLFWISNLVLAEALIRVSRQRKQPTQTLPGVHRNAVPLE